MLKLKLLSGIVILSLIHIILVGCAGHPGGLNRPRQLTDDEKAEVIEIALNTPEVQEKLETRVHYTTEINWLAITWNGSKWSAYYHIDSNWENDPNLKNVPEYAAFCPPEREACKGVLPCHCAGKTHYLFCCDVADEADTALSQAERGVVYHKHPLHPCALVVYLYYVFWANLISLVHLFTRSWGNFPGKI